MRNWNAQLETGRNSGRLHAMFPADLAILIVAPRDLEHAPR
jgi:hypothetical protein